MKRNYVYNEATPVIYMGRKKEQEKFCVYLHTTYWMKKIVCICNYT